MDGIFSNGYHQWLIAFQFHSSFPPVNPKGFSYALCCSRGRPTGRRGNSVNSLWGISFLPARLSSPIVSLKPINPVSSEEQKVQYRSIQ